MIDIGSLLQGISLFGLIKLAILILVGIYAIFSFVVFVQIRTMNALISQSLSSLLVVIFAFAHIAASVSLFILALVIL